MISGRNHSPPCPPFTTTISRWVIKCFSQYDNTNKKMDKRTMNAVPWHDDQEMNGGPFCSILFRPSVRPVGGSGGRSLRTWKNWLSSATDQVSGAWIKQLAGTGSTGKGNGERVKKNSRWCGENLVKRAAAADATGKDTNLRAITQNGINIKLAYLNMQSNLFFSVQRALSISRRCWSMIPWCCNLVCEEHGKLLLLLLVGDFTIFSRWMDFLVQYKLHLGRSDIASFAYCGYIFSATEGLRGHVRPVIGHSFDIH